jgi:hypothetical protein
LAFQLEKQFMRVVSKTLSILTIAAALAICATARGDFLSLTPIADAWVQEFQPDLNNGGGPDLVAGALGNLGNREIRRAFLNFDVSAIPPGATINSVTLTVTVVRAPISGRADSLFQLRRVLSPWSESGVTWNSRSAGVPWESPGADGAADSVPNGSSAVDVFTEGSYTMPSSASLVADVQAWVNDPAHNFGWMLQSADEATPETARRFGSRESGVTSPVLVIDYSFAALSAAVTPSQQSVVEGSSVTFNSVVTGTPPFTYQWRLNGAPLAGATADSLTLDNVQTNQSGQYAIVVSNQGGSVTSAPAILTVTNVPSGVPIVRITSPTNNAHFGTQSTIVLAADANETNGTIKQVEFFLGTNSAGIVTAAPYTLTLSNLAAGGYSVSATATDDRGTNGTSPRVSFTVVGPPTISFTGPAEHARFALGTNVPIVVNVVSNGARITAVDFYAAHFDEGQNAFVTNLIGTLSAPPFTLNWTADAAGDYSLSATALNEFGQLGSSTNLDIRIFIPELVLPVIAITDAPRNFSRITDSPIQFSGTASDNIGLDHVEYTLSYGAFLQSNAAPVTVSGTANWTMSVPLVPGRNEITFRSVDLAGNRSLPVRRFYTYVATAPIGIEINGLGAVIPNLNGHNLELGKRYSLTARPGASYVFAYWQNATPTNRPKATFGMTTGLVVTANFAPNPFLPVVGNYSGLFFDPNPNRLRPEDAGLVSLLLNKQGAFTGRLANGGASYGFSGGFDWTGHASFAVVRGAQSPLAVTLSLDSEAGAISGFVTVNSENASLVSPLLAKLNVFNGQTAIAPQAGSRRFVFLRGADTAASASAQIFGNGVVTIQGGIADGPRFTRAMNLASDGTAPCYLSFKQGQQIFIGWLDFGDGSGQNVSGQILHAVPATPLAETLDVASP